MSIYLVNSPVNSFPTGFSITPAELASQVTEYLAQGVASGWESLGSAINSLKGTQLRWANPLELKNAVESAFIEAFGAKEVAKPKGKVCQLSSLLLFD